MVGRGGRRGEFDLAPVVAAIGGELGAEAGFLAVEFLPRDGDAFADDGEVGVRGGVAAYAAAGFDAVGEDAAVEDALVLRGGAEPDGVQALARIFGDGGAVVRAGIDFPVFERHAAHGAGLAGGGDAGEGVVADVGREDVAPEGGEAAVGVGDEGDAAALATVVGKFGVVAERRTAVVGERVVNRGAAVGGSLRGDGGDEVAFIDPRDDDLAAGGDGEGVEAVGDFLAVAVDDERRREGASAVEGAGELDLAGVGFRERLGPGDVDFAGGPSAIFGRASPPVSVGSGAGVTSTGLSQVRPRSSERLTAMWPLTLWTAQSTPLVSKAAWATSSLCAARSPPLSDLPPWA